MAIHDVRNHGALGDGASDDTLAIQAAIDACRNAGGGVVWFPAGNYRVTKRTGYPRWCSWFIDASHHDICFAGEGSASRIKLMGPLDRGDYYMFRLEECERITIKDLLLDGSYDEINDNADEQTHGINAKKTRDVTIHRVGFTEWFGDGVRFWGEPDKHCERIEISACKFWKLYRNGLTLQRLSDRVIVRDNQFWEFAASALDYEPTGGYGATNAIFSGNHVVAKHASVCASFTNVKGCIVSHNNFKGCWHSVNLEDAILAHNVIDGSAQPDQRPAIDMIRAARNVSFDTNIIKARDDAAGITVSYNNGASPEGVSIRGGSIEAMTGVNITGGKEILVKDVRFKSASTPGNGAGINVQAVHDIVSVKLESNIISGFLWGTHAYASHQDIDDMQIIHQQYRDCQIDYKQSGGGKGTADVVVVDA